MNWNIVEGQWDQLKGALKEQWGKLTDDDLTEIAGNRDKMLGKLKEQYGWATEEAEEKLNQFFSDKE